MDYAFGVAAKKSLSNPRLQRFSLMYFSRSLSFIFGFKSVNFLSMVLAMYQNYFCYVCMWIYNSFNLLKHYVLQLIALVSL